MEQGQAGRGAGRASLVGGHSTRTCATTAGSGGRYSYKPARGSGRRRQMRGPTTKASGSRQEPKGGRSLPKGNHTRAWEHARCRAQFKEGEGLKLKGRVVAATDSMISTTHIRSVCALSMRKFCPRGMGSIE